VEAEAGGFGPDVEDGQVSRPVVVVESSDGGDGNRWHGDSWSGDRSVPGARGVRSQRRSGRRAIVAAVVAADVDGDSHCVEMSTAFGSRWATSTLPVTTGERSRGTGDIR
jgi:hypothetical protein